MRFLLIVALLCVAAYATLTERETYDALLASITALEARGTPDDTVKISLIIQSTKFLDLQAKYGDATPARRRFARK